jgi:hypothetical protein
MRRVKALWANNEKADPKRVGLFREYRFLFLTSASINEKK